MTYPRAFVIAGLLALSIFASSCSQTKESAGWQRRASGPAKVTQIDDAKLKELLKPKGKPLLVNFWATWCGPCREEFPDLVRIDNEYFEKVDFITVSLDFIEELNTGVPQFLEGMEARMPTYLLISADENTMISSIAKNWGGGLPFTILYNEKGETAFFREGTVDHKTLKGEIEKILAEK